LFESDGIDSRPVSDLSEGAHETVLGALTALLKYTRSLEIDEIPDFKFIKEQLQSIGLIKGL